MERLQAALEKARATRKNVGGVPAPGSRKTAGRLDNQAAEQMFAEIPMMEVKARDMKRNRIIATDQGPAAAPHDVLRTKVLQLIGAQNWKRVAITSPTPGCGKSTVAANLAASFGRLSETRVTLFDFDMRRPALAKILGQSGEYSVPDVLRGDVTLSQQARRLTPNVAISMNYARHADPTEVILRQRTVETLDDIERSYRPNLMLFDMPPLLGTDETAAFMAQVDCAIIVAEAEASTMKQIDICEKDLAQVTNVLGVVLNKCHFPDDRSGDGYYYY